MSKLRLLRGAAVVAAGPVVLELAGLVAPVAASRRWPCRVRRPGLRRAAWAVTGAGVAAPWAYALAIRPWLLHWGATDEERSMPLPGDDPDTEPLYTITRAVTVHAPAKEVWSWLVQIGQDRGGFYSYDWLENLAGCDIHSADHLDPAWQHLEPGDEIGLMPGLSTTVEDVEPGRALVIANWGSYVVEPVDGTASRLIARAHVDRNRAALAYILGIELPHAIMERKMLLGIKQRAERATVRPLHPNPDSSAVALR